MSHSDSHRYLSQPFIDYSSSFFLIGWSFLPPSLSSTAQPTYLPTYVHHLKRKSTLSFLCIHTTTPPYPTYPSDGSYINRSSSSNQWDQQDLSSVPCCTHELGMESYTCRSNLGSFIKDSGGLWFVVCGFWKGFIR